MVFNIFFNYKILKVNDVMIDLNLNLFIYYIFGRGFCYFGYFFYRLNFMEVIGLVIYIFVRGDR